MNKKELFKKIEKIIQNIKKEYNLGKSKEDLHYSIVLLARGMFLEFLVKSNFLPNYDSFKDSKYINVFDLYTEKEEFLVIPKNLQMLDLTETNDDVLQFFGWVFETFMDPDTASVTGSFYTPSELCTDINQWAFDLYEKNNTIQDGISIIDPCCGASGVLIESVKKLSKKINKPVNEIIEKNIFGIDINQEAVLLSKIRLSVMSLLEPGVLPKKINIKHGSIFDISEKYDIIVGNPPYLGLKKVKALPDVVSWCKSNNIAVSDLYILITLKSYNILKEFGAITYLTSNTYFTDIGKKHFRDFLSGLDSSRPTSELELVNIGSGVFDNATVNVAVFSFIKGKK